MKKNEKSSEKSVSNPVAEPIAIIGMSCLFPKAQSLKEYWANIKNKVDAITEIPETHWKLDEYYDPDPKKPDFTYAKRGGFIPITDFDPIEHGISPAAIEATDTSQLLGLVVANGALIDAGYGPGREFDRDAVSVIMGVTGTLELVIPLGARLGHPKWRRALQEAGVENEIIEDVIENIGRSYVSWQENSFPGLLGNVAAGRIANRLNLGGTNCVVDAACASSLGAAEMAIMELQTGRTKMAITGGIDTFNDIFMFMCFSKTPALSPTGDSRPFASNSDGTILGEGVGMVVMKRLSDAEKDGDKIYAVIKGVGTSSDGKGKAIYAPSSQGQAKALRRAYQLAGCEPETIELIEAHGTGTKVGDMVEVEALREMYRTAKRPAPWCAIGSVKSQIGHTKAAAGSAGLIKLAAALYHKVLPPTIKVKEPNPAIISDNSPFYINTEKRPWLPNPNHPRRGAISSFGFGGSNFHVVAEEYKAAKSEIDWDETTEIVALSAPTKEKLEEKGREWAGTLTWSQIKRRAAVSRREFSADHPFRLVAVIEKEKNNAATVIGNAVQSFSANGAKAFWSTPDGAYMGQGKPTGKIGVVFPGQGAQYPGMCLDLACAFPELLETLTEADSLYGKTKDPTRKLSDYIYPRPSFNPEDKKANEADLTATDVAQPSIGAVSLGAYKILDHFGLRPEGVAGHSYGELSALCAAGVLGMEDFLKISKIRGELMAKGGKEKGGMVAVLASVEEILPVLKEEKIDLVIANKNTPKQTVLSGRVEEVRKAHEALAKRKIKSTVLQVGGAFHSPLVADAAVPFKAALEKVEFKTPRFPVFANTTGEMYPKTVNEAKDLLGNQLAKPVEFVREIESMYKTGIRTFVEVGPGAKMSGLIKTILGDRDHLAVAVDSSSGSRKGAVDLARALSQLSALGYQLNLKLWEDGEKFLEREPQEKKPRMTIPICGANYRSPVPPRPAKKVTPVRPAAAQVSPVPAPAANSGPVPIPGSQPAIISPTMTQGRQVMTQQQPPSDSFKAIQQSLTALQQLQQQTADLHRRFLEGQELAQKTILALVDQQGSMPHVASSAQIQAPAYVPAYQPAPVHYAPTPVPAPTQVAVVPAPVRAVQPAPTPVAAPKPAPAPQKVAAAAPAGGSSSRVEAILLGVVSEKTGYPNEMLNLDMDMESDLGIDSIKRVEIMSGVQEKLPDAPVIKPDQLGKFRTLRQVIAHLSSGEVRVMAAPVAATPAAVSAPAAASAVFSVIEPVVLAVVSEKTGYPQEMLNLDMDMESDLGIDSIKRVEIMSAVQEKLPDAPVIKPDQLGKFRTLRQVMAHLGSAGAPAVISGSVPGSIPAATGGAPAATAPKASVPNAAPVILEIVAEKTGYPTEMLNLDMNMESDLGIDSIKRVEIMSAVQERLPNSPVIQPSQLGQFQTLRQIIEFLGASETPAPVATAPVAPVVSAPVSAPKTAPEKASSNVVEKTMVAIVSEKTGYPPEMLNLDMDMEADLGIDSIKRVEIMSAVQEKMPEAPVVQPGDLGKFRTLRQVIDYLNESGSSKTEAAQKKIVDGGSGVAEVRHETPAPAAIPLKNLARTVLTAVPFSRTAKRESITLSKGSTVLITDDGEGLAQALAGKLKEKGLKPEIIDIAQAGTIQPPKELGGVVIIGSSHETHDKTWKATDEEFLKQSFTLAQKMQKTLREHGTKGGAFLMTVSRFDGSFGLTGSFSSEPLQGGLAGLTKTAAREWPEVNCKAVDVACNLRDMKTVASHLAEEALLKDPVELGISSHGMQKLVEKTVTLRGTNKDVLALSKGDVVVISGGARGVTAETAVALAKELQPTLVLLGRSGHPHPEPEWLKPLEAEGAIKQAILAHVDKSTFTPKKLEEEYRNHMANREILRNIARIESAGSKVLYRTVDVRNPAALKGLFSKIRLEVGQIRGLVHGAGVLRDRRIEDKTMEQFSEVFDTKVGGLKALLEALETDELKFIALFSSVTGRYGRIGQVDYAMANEVLNKVAHRLTALRPECRVVSINWGPWDGGMVTDSLKKVFHNEGVDLIPLEAGAHHLVREVTAGRKAGVEVVVGSGLGTPAEPEEDPGREPEKESELEPEKAPEKPAEKSAEKSATKRFYSAFQRQLTLDHDAFLRSHVFNGNPVLPVAVMVEWLAHGALHENPGLAFHGFDDLRILKGVILKESGAAQIRVVATKAAGKGSIQKVNVELRGGEGFSEAVHARAEVLLTATLPEAPASQLNPDVSWKYPHSIEAVYEEILFHGKDLHGIKDIDGWSPNGIKAKVAPAPSPRAWMNQPLRSSWLADPLVLDSAFQLMILWTNQQCGEMSLPNFLASFRQYRSSFPNTGVKTIIHVEKIEGKIVKANMEFVDDKGKLVASIRGYECVMMPSLSDAFKRRSVEAAAQS